MTIKLYFSTIDGCRNVKTFKTLAGARKAAACRVGNTPEIGSSYAISSDGVVKVQAAGATLAELFPDCFQSPPSDKFWTVAGVSFNTYAAAAKDAEKLKALGYSDNDCHIQEWDAAEVYGKQEEGL